ncbi:DUF2237 domain-containing protein [Cocleimonas flava]|jgi:uncharacterized protein (DUF2237 family)|uniref:DUF2237 family protein n=1 Tax=Cocleimonas flava TaxID=634765 RepID=A0A4R1F3L8_9GAMM|nr:MULTISPECIES: DUF2237 domain-containing protein [Cocleimonas]MEB8432098.1 DUF2237 domain-containing protein [Cocleimonas sp. KMM 6892]MEC4714816.1 DUF2237 domain-containing protein [Cocleimonas sp. KMM 6895]MEC4744370.1 DUF2237 domain-containing protein [Cocleimonas sp. KMM 6896]TCJ87039.1 hypothetical protein EV695_1540 [Cocleimonas flava]
MQKDESVSVLGEPLDMCGDAPMTGFYRDSYCNTCDEDVGSHTVCVETSKLFLDYSKAKGNDLSTPAPQFGFAGLTPGDSWCLCAARWLEAYNDGAAPRVFLSRTHKRALDIIPLDILKQYATDLN